MDRISWRRRHGAFENAWASRCDGDVQWQRISICSDRADIETVTQYLAT